MSSHNTNIIKSIASKYNLMISKLISLLQSHLVQLMSINQTHLLIPKTSEIDKKSQKYNLILGKMKIIEQQQFFSPKYSQLCQPLLKTLDRLDQKFPESYKTQSRKSHSVSFRHSRWHSLGQSLDQSLSPKKALIKRSMNFQKLDQDKNTNFNGRNQKLNASIDEIRNPKVNKRVQTLGDSKKYQNPTKVPEMLFDVPEIPNFCKKSHQPKPGNTFERDSSKLNLGNQTTNRKIKEFQRANVFDKIDRQEQMQANLDEEDQKEVYSFDIVETSSGIVYGKQERVNQRSRFNTGIYKKSINRAHLKKFQAQFA